MAPSVCRHFFLWTLRTTAAVAPFPCRASLFPLRYRDARHKARNWLEFAYRERLRREWLDESAAVFCQSAASASP